jgi:hypothetical protein
MAYADTRDDRYELGLGGENARYASLLISCRPLTTLSRINPAKNESAPQIVSDAHNMAVGNLGTKPTAKYSLNKGIAKPIANATSKPAPIPKKANGRSNINNLQIAHKILKPSRYVESLLSDPSIRAP